MIFLLIVVLAALLLSRAAWVLWWKPICLSASLNAKGVGGPKFHLGFGTTKEMIDIIRAAVATSSHNISHDILSRASPFVTHWGKIYGTPFLFWVGIQPKLAITDPAIAAEVLSKKFGMFVKGAAFNEYVKFVLGNGIFMSDGQRWASQRRILKQVFQISHLKGLIGSLEDCAEEMFGKWKEEIGESPAYEMEVHREFIKLSGKIISRTMFGSHFIEGERVFDLQMEQMKLLIPNINSSLLSFRFSKYLLTKNNIKQWRLKKEMNSLLHHLTDLLLHDSVDNKPCLVKSMLSINEGIEDPTMKMNMDDIIGQCKSLFLAGHETTAQMMTWTVMLLAHHQEWQDRARQEALQFSSSPTTIETLNQLNIIEMVVNESLRLYPPVLFLHREADQDVHLDKLDVPKNTVLAMSVIHMHHDKKSWGEDANEFNPQRFEIKKNSNAATNAAYIPFAMGPRICLGQQLALMQAKCILVKMLSCFKFRIAPSYKHAPVQTSSLVPQHGMQIVLEKI